MRRIMVAGVVLALELSGSRAFGLNWGGGLSAMGASMSDTAGALMQQELQRQLLEQQHQQQMQEIQAQHDLQMQQLQEQTRSAPIGQPTASSLTYTSPTGEKYVGEWKDDKRNGQGASTFADRSKYVGEWKDDKGDGQGIEYAASGAIVRSGKFTNGAFVK